LIVYVDSSFLVAAYAQDAHSPEVARRLRIQLHVAITPFNQVEFANAVFRLVFLGRHSLAQAQYASLAFASDCRKAVWSPVEFPNRAWETCIELALRHGPTLGVRTLDSLHVACALEMNAQKFWTFDDRQAKLAEAVGLDTTA
jgi:predicted nucleic acid-binding protein